jgi:flagellar biogenesis protein FliO
MVDASLIISIVVFSIFLVIFAVFVRPFVKRLGQRTGSWLPIKVTARVKLNRNSELFIVEAEGSRLLIASSANGVSQISVLSSADAGTKSQTEGEAG